MSSKKYASPLQLNIKPSRILLALTLLVHLGAITIVIVMPMDLFVKSLLLILIAISCIYLVIFELGQKSGNAIVQIVWDAADEWLLITRAGRHISVKLVGDSFSHPRVTVLNFKIPGKLFQKHIVLLKDNIDENVFRRLRVRLKIANHAITDEFN